MYVYIYVCMCVRIYMHICVNFIKKNRATQCSHFILVVMKILSLQLLKKGSK